MIQLGLAGYPLEHSLSPQIHRAALNACGLQGTYSLFPAGPQDMQSLRDLLDRVRRGEINGLNVTIPHKQNVIPFLDELTPTAQAIGAVNTVYSRDNRLIGDNTDAPGFIADLNTFLPAEPRRYGEKRALVLGAGGSARAVVYALRNESWDVTLTARRIEQANQMAALFDGLKIQEWSHRAFRPSNFHLIVNTTPAGMAPNTQHSPWPKSTPFPTCAVIYDLVYNPRQTKLVRDACAQGLPATAGLGMLVEQAALSFERWTGCQPPRDKLYEAVNQTTH